LHGGLPTDRLVAEWHLASDRVEKVLSGKEPAIGDAKERVEIGLDESSPETIAQTQIQARQRFPDLFARGYVVTWFEKLPEGGAYLLEPET
jgi:predicted GNAT superfamily acetyltransferase